MDKPQFYDNNWMLNRHGIEAVFGFQYPLKNFGAEGEVKAWFLGYLHGCNERKRFNPYNKPYETAQQKSYERGFFIAFRGRYRDHEEWRQKMLEMEE